MRSLKVYSGILITVLVAFFGVIYWPSIEKLKKDDKNHSVRVQKEKDQKEVMDFQLAEIAFKKGQYDQALDLVTEYQNSFDPNTDMGAEWLDLLVKISEKTFDVPQLVLINEYYPESLQDNERASLLVAENFIVQNQNQEYEELRNRWIGKEYKKEAWAILDADHLLMQGRYQESNKILETELKGKDEVERLIRLSLINAIENPEKALSYLDQARSIDPTNLDVFLYYTKLAEKLGDNNQALDVYNRAISDNPKSVFIKDQLADFYVRQGKYQDAMKLWKEALNMPPKDQEFYQAESFLKLGFFNRVISGKKDKSLSLPSHIASKPLIAYFSNLDEHEFVDEMTFSMLPLKEEYLNKEQVIYWLSLLNTLKKNDLDKALSMLLLNPFKDASFNPHLEFALIQVLNYQKTGTLIHNDLKDNSLSTHPLLKSLSSQTEPTEDIQALINSDEIFSSLLLAHNWTEAGLQLHKVETFPERFPKWAAFDLTQALRKNHGDKEALKFVAKQKYQEPDLALLSQEMSARTAFAEGNVEFAEKIYEAIADRSFEAKSYLARKAFKEGHFEIAQKLTEELLQKYPTNSTLLENLKRIQAKNIPK